jgi:hypothetical protein
MALELSVSNACEIGKAGAEEERQRIMSWFGISYTGDTIPFRNSRIPAVNVVDEAQMHRAQADPFGYLRRASAAHYARWGEVKSIYR